MKLSEIINWGKTSGYQFDFVGDSEAEIEGFSSLTNYKSGTITWIKRSVPENADLLCSIRCAVIQSGLSIDIENAFYSDNSKELFFAILTEFFSTKSVLESIGSGTVLGENVTIEDAVRIGCNCTLEGMIHIGRGTVIEHNVVILNSVTIGEDCIIHSGTVIGTDGYGYSFDKENLPQKVPHFGGVKIGSRVEIGAVSTVDRGTIDDTVLEDDVKLDNLVHVAHNVYVGRGSMLVAGVVLCGSCRIGEQSYIAPNTVVKNQLSVGNNSLVGMGVTVSRSIEDNTVLASSNSKPVKFGDYRMLL